MKISILPSGDRVQPFFKPSWNPDLLLSQNYICHLAVYRREMVVAGGGLRVGFEGAQDYDLALRMSEVARQIVHIPHVLYHWRILKGSTSLDPNEKGYAHKKAVAVIEDTMKRRGLRGQSLRDGYGCISSDRLPN